MRRTSVKSLQQQQQNKKKASRTCSEAKRQLLRTKALEDGKKNYHRQQQRAAASGGEWAPMLYFRPEMTDLEIWKRIETLDVAKQTSELVATRQLDVILRKGLLGAGNLAMQRASLAILCEASKSEQGCLQLVPHVSDLYKICVDWDRRGLEISAGCIGLVGNLAMENASLCQQLLPVLAALSQYIQRSTPDLIVHRLMQMLVDSTRHGVVSPHHILLLPVLLRTIDKKHDLCVLERTLVLFERMVLALGTEDCDRFLKENSAFVGKLLPYYCKGSREAVAAIESLSMGDAGLVLHRLGYSGAALSILSNPKVSEWHRLCAGTLLNNLFASEEVAPFLWQDHKELFPTVLALFVQDQAVRFECSDILKVALTSDSTPESVVTIPLLEALAAMLLQPKEKERGEEHGTMRNVIDILDHFYESPTYRAMLFESEVVCKGIDSGLERLERSCNQELALAAAELLEKIERIEQARDEECDDNSGTTNGV